MKLILIVFVINHSVGRGWADSKVRAIEMEKDQVALIRTSVGVATIVEVPDAPNSVVVGNPESFKVEYLDRAITLKPLSSKAKSNMYIYTDFRRYNVELVTVNKGADYVVYLKNASRKFLKISTKPEAPQFTKIVWKKYVKKLNCEKFDLSIKRLGIARESILIDFEIKSNLRGTFDPKNLWIKQKGKTVTIQALLFSKLDYNTNQSIQGVIEVKNKDINHNLPFDVEVRSRKGFKLTLRRVSKWKYL